MTHFVPPHLSDDSSGFINSEAESADVDFDMLRPVEATGATSLPFVVRIKGREFFMKQLKPELLDNETYRNLFRKEFDLGKRLDSPYIVKYEQLVENEKEVYILCENVCGSTLDEKLRVSPEWFTGRKHLDRLFSQLLEAVGHMHSNHVVHADLKPQNVMLTRINNDVKVIDLGFAFADSYTYTTGRTPGYAAPEQQGDCRNTIDACADIYAIGKIMAFVERESGKRLPKIYQTIKKRCLQEDPRERYQNVDEIVQLINRRRRILQKTIISVSLCAMLGAVGLFFFNTVTGYNFLNAIKWTMKLTPYDIRDRQVLYQFTSPDSTTCCVVGAKVSFFGNSEHDGENIKIKSRLTLPSGKVSRVTHISDKAFFEGKNFTSAMIPDGIESIGELSFSKCPKITCINLPPSVREIKEEAFSLMDNLQVLHLPDSLTEIPIGMAHHCPSLRSIKLPVGIRTLPLDIFASNTHLQEVLLPDSLERIERGVFWECRKLPQITLPATVKYIGEYAFFHCDSLKHVYLYAPEPPEMSNAFRANGSQLTIHVPKASLKRYKTHFYWKRLNLVGDL